jgi:hypothetical protein
MNKIYWTIRNNVGLFYYEPHRNDWDQYPWRKKQRKKFNCCSTVQDILCFWNKRGKIAPEGAIISGVMGKDCIMVEHKEY